MDYALLSLMNNLHTRDDVLSNIMNSMKKENPQVFANFVSFCNRNMGSWMSHLRSTSADETRDVPILAHYEPELTDDEVEGLLSFFKGKTLCLTATQSVGRGGSATNAYKLTKFFRANGIRCACIFIQDFVYDELERYDPDNIGGVWRVPRFTDLNRSKNSLVRTATRRNIRSLKQAVKKYLGGDDPDIILGKNYISPIVSRFLYPSVKLVYLVSGSWHCTQLLKCVGELINVDPNKLNRMVLPEVEAIKAADLIIPNSSIGGAVFGHIYNEFAYKISPPIDTSNIEPLDYLLEIENPVDGWSDRPYDIAFIASSLGRKIKGPNIAEGVFGHPSLAHLKKLVVGEQTKPPMFQNVQHCTFSDRLPHSELMAILSKVRIICLCSLFDSSPNLMSECLNAGVYPVASVNIGNSEKLDPVLVVKDVFSTDEWAEAILNTLSNPSKKPLQRLGKVPLATSILHKLQELVI